MVGDAEDAVVSITMAPEVEGAKELELNVINLKVLLALLVIQRLLMNKLLKV